MKKFRFTKEILIKLIISTVLVIALFCSFPFSNNIEQSLGLIVKHDEHQVTSKDIENSNYYVSYLDVGQGNSSFVKLPDGKTMIIDGGDAEYGESIGDFLDSHGVETIDYMIATHADSDHIGGLNYVLEHYEVRNVFRPFQISGTGTNIESFEVYEYEQLGEVFGYLNLLTSNKSKMSRVTTLVYKNFIKNIYTEKYSVDGVLFDCNVMVFYDGLVIDGPNYKIEFFAPLKRIEDIDLTLYTTSTSGYATIGYGTTSDASNDNSAIFTVDCFSDKYLFMGDARFTDSSMAEGGFSETDFIDSLTNLEKEELSNVDVLIVGHHGSKYSTSERLLELVLPRFVVISSGNEYDHPADETLQRLNQVSSIEADYLVRTDTNGDIEFSFVDGTIKYSLEKTDIKQELLISYKLLSSILVCYLIFIVFSIKVKKSRT